MRFSAISAAFGLVASVVAQDVNFDPIYTPGAYEEVPTGQPFTITWTAQPAAVVDALISITLIGGPEQNTQVPLYTIAESISNSAGSFVWTPDANEFGKNFYGLMIKNLANGNQFQYSNPFKLVKGSSNPVTTPTDVATTDATTATELPEVTKTVSLSSLAAETTSAVVVPSVGTVEAVPTAAPVPTYVPAPVHNNGTASLTRPSTLTSVATGTGSESTGPATVPVPTGGAAAQGFSVALLGAGALLALAI